MLYIADENPEGDPAFHRALRLTELAGAELSVAVAIGEAPTPADGLLGVDPTEVSEVISEHHRKRLEKIVAPLRSERRSIESRVLTGRPEVAITREAVARDVALVIKRAGAGTERKGRPSGLDQKLVRGCPCPVWIEHAEDSGEVRRLLIPVDANPQDHAHRILARQVLELGLSLAEIFGAHVDIVHAWHAYGEVEMRSGFARTTREKVDAYVERHREMHARWLDELVDEVGSGGNVRAHLVKGAPEHVIPGFAAEIRPDLIVMGTIARTGVRGLVLGNTAESVLGHVQCGVLFVKPPGFTTPFPLSD